MASGSGRLRIRYAAKIPSKGPSIPAEARSSIRLSANVTLPGHGLARAWASMPGEASTATTRARGAAASSAAVEAPVPHPASSSRSPSPSGDRDSERADPRRSSW